MTDRSVEVLSRYVEQVINGGDLEAIDQFVARDLVDHDPNNARFPDEAAGPDETGLQRAKRHITDLRTAAPDLHYALSNMRVSGDRIDYHWTAHGTHLGPYLGFPATGREVKIDGTGSVRIEDGKIAETWDEWDAMDLIRQITG
jgi:steroid delta-isomerase-like uncharacterized protein